MSRLLIVDGHAYAYRAFHAIRELRSPSGQATNAIYGFIKMLAKLRANLSPTHSIVVWDGGLAEERVKVLPEYKAQRPEMPADLATQIDEIVAYLEAARIASFCREGIEADDYIACLVRHAVAADIGVVIASSDKDFMQLVTPEVGMMNPNDKSETIWSANQVRAKTGVEPAQIVDYLALLGDSVDNIPGVPGVGPKTAADLLKQFGSVKEIYRRIQEVKSERIRGALMAAAKDVQRNQELVRLRDDLTCEFSAEEMLERGPDAGKLAPLLKKWGFRSMLAELEASQTRQEVLL